MTSTQTDPHGHHDWTSPEYVDRWIASDIMNDDERRPMMNGLARRLPVDRDAPIRILDVGAGYGILSNEILQVLENAHVVLQDISEAMLGHARSRLSDFSDRTTFVTADFREPGWTADLGGPFDAVVSSLAIHNVRDPVQIRRIYGDIAGVLTDGGCFVNIDLIGGDGPRSGAALGQRAGSDAATTNAWRNTASLVEQLGWLRELGFNEVDCLYRQGVQTALAGFR